MRLRAGLAAALMLMIAPPAYAEDEPRSLAPSGPWVVDYADDSCNIAREFGEGDQAITLIMRRYSLPDFFELTLVGRPLSRASQRRNATLRFGPNEDEQEVRYFVGEIGDVPALIFRNQIRIAPLNTAEQGDSDRTSRDESEPEMLLPVSTARLQAVEHLLVEGRGFAALRLEFYSFAEVFEAFDACIHELVTHWGIDLERHRGMIRPATPRGNPGNWIRNTDYPGRALRRGTQTLIHFRLSVGSNGRATDCHIQQSTRAVEFDAHACQLLTRRARFNPALDADGQPIASYYISTVIFQMGR